MLDSVRPPAVAGTFYPASPRALRSLIDELLASVEKTPGPRPKVLVVPHAGYAYSGSTAAHGYALFLRDGARISRVILLGPAHRAYLDGVAAPGAEAMRTPLGDLRIDADALARAEVAVDAEAHRREHSIEVQLPFVQAVAPSAAIVPLVVGHASPDEVARVLRSVWGGPETVVVVSSDLSHYLPYDVGREADARTAARIVALDGPLSGQEACGAAAVNGLLVVAREKGLRARVVRLESSGDTAGPRDEVVGYGAFALYDEGAS
jgi:AmmeMemoRadiSam system protein B